MWKRFYARFPFDPESLFQLPSAVVASAIVNANGGRDGKAVGAHDMLMFKPPEKPESLDEKWGRIRSRIHSKAENKPA